LQPVLAAQAATKSIPIIFAIGGDPAEIGLVIAHQTFTDPDLLDQAICHAVARWR
jgi:hypothetical protein